MLRFIIHRKFLPQTYFDLSVTIKWMIVGLVDVSIMTAIHILVSWSCKNDFGDCVVELLAMPMITISGICLLGMIGVLLEWVYGKRHQMREWIMNKWNYFNNNVVEIQAPALEDNNNGVKLKRLSRNQTKQYFTD